VGRAHLLLQRVIEQLQEHVLVEERRDLLEIVELSHSGGRQRSPPCPALVTHESEKGGQEISFRKKFRPMFRISGPTFRTFNMSSMAWEEAGRLAFQNLLLLGFDADDAERRHGVAVNEQSFLQQHMAGSGLGPHKAMEVVMHFLMLKGLPPDVLPPLKMLFPVVEKQQGRDFRKFLTDSLAALQKARELPPSPLIRSTVFDSPCGPKFCQVLFHFSQHVMRRQLIAMSRSAAPLAPPFQRQNARSLVRVVRLRVARERHTFLEHIRRTGAAHEHWAQFAHEFVEAHAAAAGSRAEVEAAQQALLAQEADSDVCLDHETAEARAEGVAQRVQSMWAALEASGVSSASRRESVERLLVDAVSEKNINIAKLMKERSHALDPSSPVVNESLDMEALMQRWAASIGQVHRQLLQNTAGRAGLEQLAKCAPDVQALADEAQARLASAQTLRVQIAADVELVRRSINDLRRTVAQRYEGTVMDHDASLEEGSELRSASDSPSVKDSLATRNSPMQDASLQRRTVRDHAHAGSSVYSNGSPSSRDRTDARLVERLVEHFGLNGETSYASSRSPFTVERSPLAAAQQRPNTQTHMRTSPVGSVGMNGWARESTSARQRGMMPQMDRAGVIHDEGANEKLIELDLRMQQLRKQLASSPQSISSSTHALDTWNSCRSPQALTSKRPGAPVPTQLAAEIENTSGQVKPSPPATPPPLFAALRGKRLSNGTPSPPMSKTVLEHREVVVGKEAACDPAQSEIERRRASLRSKLVGALNDDILVPPLSLAAVSTSAGEVLAIKQTNSPPKVAGKGSVVQDEASHGRYFDE